MTVTPKALAPDLDDTKNLKVKPKPQLPLLDDHQALKDLVDESIKSAQWDTPAEVWRIKYCGRWLRLGSQWEAFFYTERDARRALGSRVAQKISQEVWRFNNDMEQRGHVVTKLMKKMEHRKAVALARKYINQLVHDGFVEIIKVYDSNDPVLPRPT